MKLNILKNLKSNVSDNIIKLLASKGDKMIHKAYESKETQDRTLNQKDAYGWAIYKNGEIYSNNGKKYVGYITDWQEADEMHKGWRKRGIRADYGRNYLNDFFTKYEPKGRLELVVVNAVYYTQILEDGKHVPKGLKYRIISQIRDDIDDLQSKLKRNNIGSSVSIISPVGHFGNQH